MFPSTSSRETSGVWTLGKTNSDDELFPSESDIRDLSEISRGGRGVETEGGSQLFETQKREGS